MGRRTTAKFAGTLLLSECFRFGKAKLNLGNVTARRSQPAKTLRFRRLALALSLLADPLFDHLLGAQSEFAALPQTLSRLASRPDGELCHVVTYS